MKLSLGISVCLGLVAQVFAQSYWYETIDHQGVAPYNPQGTAYQVFRNVKDFGAKGDGVTDDTAAINSAISSGSRCVEGAPGCESSTTSPAVVYFPAGTYLISSSILPYYMTQLIGNPNDLPVLKATAGFSGLGLVDGDPYGSSVPDYGTTNVFYRQVRNFVFDTTNIAATTAATGIHWPTAQATSLQNIVFQLSQASPNSHVGVFIENGSGGFLTDLTFYGGSPAMNVGSQQFTTRNLTFSNSVTAINQIWDWGWTYMGVTIDNCGTGFDLSAVGTVDGVANGAEVGSVIFIDSTISNTPIGVKTSRSSSTYPISGASLALENVALTNVPTAIQGPSGVVLAGTSGTTTIAAYLEGNVYSGGSTSPTVTAGSIDAFPRPSGLLNGADYYTRSKPQYESLAVSQFSSVRTAGAKGDGVTDDSAALQSIINSATAAGNVVYIDAGIYKVTTTISIPPGAKIVGETYPVIMGSGSFFSDVTNPKPVIQVGSASGETGVVEWTDTIVSTQGATEGAILIEWNLSSPSSGPSGMWDVHTRIGGFTGSNLQVSQCATGAAQPNTNCIAAFQSMHITSVASGVYLENVWLWSADHDIDDASDTQITVYSGRGLLVESTTGNIWLIGTAVEHHTLYQYQFTNTQNIFMGFIQTETPYYQPSPQATTPFDPVSSRNDPDFSVYCAGKDATCNDAWGLRVLSSKNILVYGAGLYSFFNNYSTTCSAHTDTTYTEDCQTQIFGVDEGGDSTQTYSGSTIYIYGLSTLGAVSMIDNAGTSIAAQSDNTNAFAETVAMYIAA